MQRKPATPFWTLLGLTLMIAVSAAVAQTANAPAKRTPTSAAVPATHRAAVLEMSQMPKPLTGPVDPQIAAALKNVSAAHVRATIEKLVSFGSRLTIGPPDPQTVASGKGIGAARE